MELIKKYQKILKFLKIIRILYLLKLIYLKKIVKLFIKRFNNLKFDSFWHLAANLIFPKE